MNAMQLGTIAAFIVDSAHCEEKDQGIRQQCQHIGAFCAAYDLTITRWHRYEDLDADLASFLELLKAVKRCEIHTVLVGDWKTIVRVMKHAVQTHKDKSTAGWPLDDSVSADEIKYLLDAVCDTDTMPSAECVFRGACVISTSEHVESQTIVGAIMRASLTAYRYISAATNMATSRSPVVVPEKYDYRHVGTLPYGYRHVPDSNNPQGHGRIVIDEHAAQAIRYAYSLHAQGHSLTHIADVLNDHGFRTAMGERFLPKQVSRILRRQTLYEGVEYQTSGRWGERTVQYPPILHSSTDPLVDFTKSAT